MSAHVGPRWLFDLGNTSLKGRCVREGHAPLSLVLPWDHAQFERALDDGLAGWPAPDRVLVASVVSAARAARLAAALRRCRANAIKWLASPRQGCGITTAYRVPARLGVDRFLAMAGARAASNDGPCVVVGCGTALTLDAIDADGRQREGLIIPSPKLMIRSMQGGTAIADTNPDAFVDRSGGARDDTAEAIRAGCWRAAVALVAAFHATHRGPAGDAPLWLHGGGAPELQARIDAGDRVPARLLEDAVWRGMEIWAASPPPCGART